jgi:hypothetical protein
MLASESAVHNAVVQGTNEKHNLAWKRYNQYIFSVGIIHDVYLDSFSRGQKHRILGAFAASLRQGRFYSKQNFQPKAASIRATLDCVAQAFKLADRPDPRLDFDAKVAFLLQRQLRSYTIVDKPEVRQAAVTASILRQFNKIAISSADKAMSELFTGAFFFAMHSCEYLKVSGPRKTKIIALRNIRFFIGNKLLKHSDPNLHLETTISITFEEQKRDSKNDIITHHRTKDPLLCPVKIWCKRVRRLLSYPSTTPDTTVNTFYLSNKTKTQFTGPQLLKRLRQAAASIGSDTLGFTPDQLGLHSARSGAAMAMYLAGVPVFTIMLLGRWSSDAFLRYIRKQVKEFSTGISQKMLLNENFYTVPMTSSDDPRIGNHPLNLSSRNKNGISFKSALNSLVSIFH